MTADKKNTQWIAKAIGAVLVIFLLWTSFSLYHYYTGPKVKIDNYISHLARKEYDDIYNMLDKDGGLNIYSKEQIIQYYTKTYDIENVLVQMVSNKHIFIKSNTANKNEQMAICNVKYIYTNKEEVAPLYLIKKGKEWKIRFPFSMSEVKIYAPLGSKVYINNQKVDTYEDKTYIQKDVLPGRYLVKVEFLDEIYNTYNKIIDVPKEKEVFLPYNALNVEVKTIKNMKVELQGIQKESDDGIAVFKNILEGNYRLKVLSSNKYIESAEKDVEINKDTRVLNMLDITLSEMGKEKLNNFIKDFYKNYLKDIKEQKCSHILTYFNKNTNEQVVNDFRAWFIENKEIKQAKITVRPTTAQIDKDGFLHSNVLETIEIVNKEFDKFENRYLDKQYKIILEWNTKIDISGDEWFITDRTINQSIVSYKDSDGKWVQY